MKSYNTTPKAIKVSKYTILGNLLAILYRL